MPESFTIFNFFDDLPPEDIFIFSQNKNYNYYDTLQIVNTYSKVIADLRLNSEYAAVVSDNCPESIFLVLALWECGIIPVMISSRLNDYEINELLDVFSSGHIFLNKKSVRGGLHLPFTKFPFEFYQTKKVNNRILSPEKTAVIIYTSGSTGRAKGVELTFRTFIESGKLQNKFLDQKQAEKWLLSLPFYHIGGFSILFRALLNKMSLIVPDSLKTVDLCTSIQRDKPDYISLVGTQLKQILDADFEPGYKLKNILIGGGFTDNSIITGAINKGWNVSKVYGSTETASFIAAANRDTLKLHPSAAGKEIAENTIFVLDDQRNIQQENSEGEVALKYIPLMKGYLKDQKSTERKFHNDFFLTGDIGYKTKDGIIFLEMRRTDLIVSGGENINPKEIESAILSINGIDDVYVFGEPDVQWGQIAAAAVSSSRIFTGEDLKKTLSGKLAGYKIPKIFYFVENIPRNALGKVQITSLKKLLEAEKLKP